jgi:hypothetical protein
MTLVAGLSIGGAPAFVADLLTSWRLRDVVTIPTQPAPGIFDAADGYSAKGLAQKIIIVRPYLMVVYAGNLSIAENIIAELDLRLPRQVAEVAGNEDLILSILDGTPDTLEIVALYFNNESIYPFCAHTRGFEIDGRRI